MAHNGELVGCIKSIPTEPASPFNCGEMGDSSTSSSWATYDLPNTNPGRFGYVYMDKLSPIGNTCDHSLLPNKIQLKCNATITILAIARVNKIPFSNVSGDDAGMTRRTENIIVTAMVVSVAVVLFAQSFPISTMLEQPTQASGELPPLPVMYLDDVTNDAVRTTWTAAECVVMAIDLLANVDVVLAQWWEGFDGFVAPSRNRSEFAYHP